MTIDVIMDELMKLHSEVNHMYRPFGNLEKMVDCDEPPKREDNYKIRFVKNGKPYSCDIESKDFCKISPNDLIPVLDCFKSDFQNKLKIERNRYDFIVKKLNELKRDAEANAEFI